MIKIVIFPKSVVRCPKEIEIQYPIYHRRSWSWSRKGLKYGSTELVGFEIFQPATVRWHRDVKLMSCHKEPEYICHHAKVVKIILKRKLNHIWVWCNFPPSTKKLQLIFTRWICSNTEEMTNKYCYIKKFAQDLSILVGIQSIHLSTIP